MNTKIILIDDDDDDRLIFREAIKSNGYESSFTEYANGESFIKHMDIVQESMPYLIFLDINMPKTDGYTLLNLIRKSERFGKCAVVMYTTSNSQHDITFAEQNHASGFAAKPSDYNKLEELVKKAVDHFFPVRQDKAIFFSML